MEAEPNTLARNIIFGTFACFAAITVPFVSPVVRRTGAPFFPTSKRRLNRLFNDILPAHFPKQSVHGRRFVDLGSGDGRAVFFAAKHGMYGMGLENNAYLYSLSLLSKYRNTFVPLPSVHRHLVNFKLASFYKVDCSSYDVVMIFGVTEIMDAVSVKLLRELPSTSIVVSSQFQFEAKGWELLECTEEFYLYRKLKRE